MSPKFGKQEPQASRRPSLARDGEAASMEPPMARDSQDDRRGHYRLRYPEAERPTARINDLDYLVVDISEGGVRVLLAGGRGLRRDQRFAGTVLFPDGETVPIEGVVLRSTERHQPEAYGGRAATHPREVSVVLRQAGRGKVTRTSLQRALTQASIPRTKRPRTNRTAHSTGTPGQKAGIFA